jgi:L-fuconolactonase
MRLDAHQHFWKYSAADYPWIPAGSALQRDWLPADLDALQAPLGFDGSIAVQAHQSVAEARWLLELAAANPRIRGVVGWVDLRSDRVADSLAELSANPRFVGVRHVVQDEPDDLFLIRPEFVRGISQLRQFGLTYDLLVFPKQLPAAIQLVRQFPDQPFVLDHIAKPFIKAGTLSPWREQIRELASFPNVWCKVSGMVTEADHRMWKPDDFLPYLEVVFEAFGVGRLMFGSDWPVCLLAAGYDQVFSLVRDFALKSVPDANGHEALFGGNAANFYLRRSTAGR